MKRVQKILISVAMLLTVGLATNNATAVKLPLKERVCKLVPRVNIVNGRTITTYVRICRMVRPQIPAVPSNYRPWG